MIGFSNTIYNYDIVAVCQLNSIYIQVTLYIDFPTSSLGFIYALAMPASKNYADVIHKLNMPLSLIIINRANFASCDVLEIPILQKSITQASQYLQQNIVLMAQCILESLATAHTSADGEVSILKGEIIDRPPKH